MLPTSLPGGRPAGITAARPTSPRAASAGQVRHARGFERRAAAELGERLVGATVGHQHDVLHDRDGRAAKLPSPRRIPSPIVRSVPARTTPGRSARSSSRSWRPRAAVTTTTRRRRPAVARRDRPRPRRRRRRRRPGSTAPTSRSPRSPTVEDPTAWRCARATRRCTSPSRWAASARRATASSSTSPCSTSPTGSACGGEQGLLGLAFSPDGTALYVHYTNPDGDTQVDEYAIDGDIADPSTRREILHGRAAAAEPQRRAAGVRPRRQPLHRARRRRRRRRPGRRDTPTAGTASRSTRCSARSCASTRRHRAAAPYTIPPTTRS